MSEPIETRLKPFNPLADKTLALGGRPDLFLRPEDECARFSLRVPVGALKKAAVAFEGNIPENIGEMSVGTGKSALCLGPDEWLLRAPYRDAQSIIVRFSQLYETAAHSLVDVSYCTLGIKVCGPRARLALNSGCPLDLENMPAGRCTRTVLAKAQIILLKFDDQHYRLEIARSFAPYIWEFLKNAGKIEEH